MAGPQGPQGSRGILIQPASNLIKPDPGLPGEQGI